VIEYIVLGILALGFLGFGVFIYLNSQKQMDRMLKRLEESNQMQMAGSFQEYERVKQGKKPTTNNIKNEPNFPELSEDNPIPFDQIQGIKLDNEPKRKIKIYK